MSHTSGRQSITPQLGTTAFFCLALLKLNYITYSNSSYFPPKPQMRTAKINKQLKKQQHQMKTDKQISGIDLGNTWIRVFYGDHESIIRQSMQIENSQIILNKTANPACITDTMFLMGKKWLDQSFQDVIKYYDCTFEKGLNKNILLVSKNANIGDNYYLQLPLSLVIKGVLANNASINFLMFSKKQVKFVCTIFEGKLNSYRLAIKQCFKLNKIYDLFFVNTNTCLATSYLKNKHKVTDETEVIGSVDFGAQGMTFSLHKLYYTAPGFVETLAYEISHEGGLKLTTLLVDYVSDKLIKEKGMDITKNSFLMHKLKLLCDQAKHVLSINQKAFIRLDGLPNILVYGCEVSISQFEKCISRQIQSNVSLICEGLKKIKEKVSSIVLTGGSCQVPLFRMILNQKLGDIPVIEAKQNWIKEGLLLIKTQKIQALDICPFDLRMEGDQKLSARVVEKGQLVPLRKRHTIKFPSGQLTLTIKFYQNDQLVAIFVVPQRPNQNTFSLFVEIDHNKMLNIYATTSQGLIKTHVNFMEIPREQYIKYAAILEKMDFNIDQ